MPDNESLVGQAQRHGTLSPQLIEAMRATDRAWFVPEGTSPEETYDDRPISIGNRQTTSQPSLIAAMISGLKLDESSRVLEVGTGFGYQTALLARLAAEVISVDRIEVLIDRARANLSRSGVRAPRLYCANVWEELPEPGPYDAIVVSAASEYVPPLLKGALRDGGRIVIPLGPGGNEVVTTLELNRGNLVTVQRIAGARFVPLLRDRSRRSS